MKPTGILTSIYLIEDILNIAFRGIVIDKPPRKYIFINDIPIPKLSRLLIKTYQIWKSGVLSKYAFGSYFAKSSACSLSMFVQEFTGNRILQIFSLNVIPDEEEYVYYFSDSGLRTSCVLTNKRFFYYNEDNKSLRGEIKCEDISSCQLKKSFVTRALVNCWRTCRVFPKG